jgi:ParB-like chromosome segregation protein Spo0J
MSATTTAPVMPRHIKIWPTAKLRPYDRNARTHSDEQVAQIAASIREFGFLNPILVEAGGGVIAGHGRLLAARLLGMEEVPVVVLNHLSDTQRRQQAGDECRVEPGAAGARSPRPRAGGLRH